MIRRFLRALVMVPAFVALAALAMANRHPVTVSFDPFDAADHDLVMTLPLYVLAFTMLVAGVLVGGIAAWLGQGRHRRLGARLAAENAAIRSELAALKAGPGGRTVAPLRRAS